MKFAKLRALPFVGLLLPLDLIVACVILAAAVASLPLLLFRRRQTVTGPVNVPNMFSVTIQILNWDGLQLLKECLPSVVEAVRRHSIRAGGKLEVVVVDNGSSDGSVDYIRQQFPDVRVVTLDRNYGFSLGNNKGLRQVRSDIVVLLNNDMVVAPDFLQPLLTPFVDSRVFAVASQVFFADPGRRREETGKTMGRFTHGFFDLWHEEIRGEDGIDGENVAAIPVFWAGGGSCAIDVRKLASIGGFDSLYHPFYVEDVDASWQAWKRGWKCLFAPQSHVEHKHRGTSRPKFGDGFVDGAIRRNQFLFIWKNVTEVGMILQHLVFLPRIHGRAILQKGAGFEIHSYLGAVVRLPLAVWRRMTNIREYVVSDSGVLRSLR